MEVSGQLHYSRPLYQERFPDIQWIGGWVIRTANLDAMPGCPAPVLVTLLPELFDFWNRSHYMSNVSFMISTHNYLCRVELSLRRFLIAVICPVLIMSYWMFCTRSSAAWMRHRPSANIPTLHNINVCNHIQAHEWRLRAAEVSSRLRMWKYTLNMKMKVLKAGIWGHYYPQHTHLSFLQFFLPHASFVGNLVQYITGLGGLYTSPL